MLFAKYPKGFRLNVQIREFLALDRDLQLLKHFDANPNYGCCQSSNRAFTHVRLIECGIVWFVMAHKEICDVGVCLRRAGTLRRNGLLMLRLAKNARKKLRKWMLSHTYNILFYPSPPPNKSHKASIAVLEWWVQKFHFNKFRAGGYSVTIGRRRVQLKWVGQALAG